MVNIKKGYRLEDFLQSNHTNFKPFYKKIKTHCLSHDTEQCGLGTSKNVYFLKNKHQTPKFNFEIDSCDYFDILSTEEVLFVWHSHVVGTSQPSICDVDYSKSSSLPFLIYSTVTDKFCFFYPYTLETVYFSI